MTKGGLHGYHWLIAVVLGISTWVFGYLFRLLPDNVCPQFGKKNNKTDSEEESDGTVKKQSSIKRQNSSLRGKLRGSFRSHSKQGSLRPQGSAERYVVDKPNSHRKQQSSQNLAPHEKDYK